jgi:asparagine synthase (glutamine-hydrolysing)
MLKFVVNYSSMCGYLLNLEINPVGEKFDFDQAFQKIKYRGPDFTKVDTSTLSDNKLTYGHHRLAIIDLKQESNQPFNSECGQFTMLFNGEIFNYKELRDKYLNSNDFNTNSDTEVLLQLYMKYREAMLPWLDGFFSFVIIDRVQNEVFGCVDPFGVKPMYIECNDRYLRVGSELSCLRSGKFFGSEVSHTALRDFFRYSHIPAPRSIISSISKAEQGSFFVFDNSIGTLFINILIFWI